MELETAIKLEDLDYVETTPEFEKVDKYRAASNPEKSCVYGVIRYV